MTKLKHTPGPWKIHTPSQFLLPPPDHANFLIEFGPGDWGGFWVVAHKGVSRHTMRTTNPMADASLIASSPNLLAAVEQVLLVKKNGGSMNNIDWPMLRDAVAKAALAEGEDYTATKYDTLDDETDF